MIRFGLISTKSTFQFVQLKTSNIKLVKLVRPFSCSLSQKQQQQQQLNNELAINPLCSPSHYSSQLIYFNPVLTTNRLFHTMNVTRNKNSDQTTTTVDNQSSGDNLAGKDNSKTQQGQTINNEGVDPKDKKGRFKALIRDYGLTAIIFHVTISLASLGICYLLVNSSLPMEKIFIYLGIDQKLGNLSDAASTSTNFVVAYAVHKSLALIRLSITAACVPIIVRYLRSKGIIKTTAKIVKKVD